VRRQASPAAAPAAELEQTIGYRFADPALLREALTHSSAIAHGRRGQRSNERLEFLGDRVLGLAVADLLMVRFPGESEGALTKRHAGLVCRETLAEIALELDLGRFLVLGRSEEEAGGRARPATLANGLEALIGAVYLDGGLAPAERLIELRWGPRLAAMLTPPRDAKTALQEWAHTRGAETPAYTEVSRSGPDHAPEFEVEVSVGQMLPGRGRGRSKREAEQQAAAAVLRREGVWGEG
jgi:ribonuclease-3